ncbi:MAG: hypothetical protein M5U34_35405 [Chloroflexi bacterium]|nr:hypothetical protein [Chloroflexota bacterium]
MELDTRVDLVDLDNTEDPFARRLAASGELVPVVWRQYRKEYNVMWR